MKFYERTEPGQRDNELHSLIGTEVRDIGDELEQYYKKYFADRSKVVALHEKYESVFAQLQEKADTLTSKLNALSASIETDTGKFNEQAKQFESDKESFRQRANGGGFDSQAQFDSERATLLARADELIAFRASIEKDIQTYNRLASELNKLSVQAADLNKSINSSLAPVPSL
jgi:chromosome segregation ATPase